MRFDVEVALAFVQDYISFIEVAPRCCLQAEVIGFTADSLRWLKNSSDVHQRIDL